MAMSFFHEHIVLPLGDILKGERVSKYLNLLLKTKDWSNDQIASFQCEKVAKLIPYIAAHVPYYREWFAERGVDPVAIRSIGDLNQLPIVDKAFMRNEGVNRFLADAFPAKDRMASHSSGSTGVPFSFFVSKESYSVNMATKLFAWYCVGYRLGDSYMKIANSERQSRIKKLQDTVNNCIFIPFFSMNEENMGKILEQIERKHPKYVRSYPIPLYLLARYRKLHAELFTHQPSLIMTTGSTLSIEHRTEIEEAFGCDVIDSYGCEGTPNTYETLSHDGYHVSWYYGLIEVLDENNCAVENGIGRVVSTDFWNYAMPFVRYDTGDLVEMKEGHIVRIIGRQADVYSCPNGDLFTVHNFNRFFSHDIHSVNGYQIVKHNSGSVTFRLVVNEKYKETDGKAIIAFWQQKLGVPVDVVLLEELPLMNNNKRRVIVED